MPSFDVVSEVDLQEVRNAADQANREVGTRFDFKGSDASFSLENDVVTLHAQTEFQLEQMMDILQLKLVKRSVDIGCLDIAKAETANNRARQAVTIRQGIDTDTARKIVKDIKGAKIKVQAQIQGEQVRVTGKSRDDLQNVIAMLRKADFGLPLQYINFRD
ncbi:MAG TPA: YajQ family cyclic di-GMP-binding protein [Gammaproteobacteria bacterium]|nr:YajQ family cyclic di-GMP-binding protein [Gammaproteobacteria bacterium]MCP5431434.1 YajQ family cyclic di-GMP-binding protein [Chromatiaceae bacterium]MCW5587311.1 YajQ family cyclic di-GMP-binding protein [Chromatiales bacterium]MCP5433939.1 YajQ family cyclic di-GMP-binding protein [Chromatiaceae bacterium]MCP5435742.1 YajQ family cyclic di-GMP-binding protein [Chromatiaceae bacterium]